MGAKSACMFCLLNRREPTAAAKNFKDYKNSSLTPFSYLT
jgi:hypothetical protein